MKRWGFPEVPSQSVGESAVDKASLAHINRRQTLTNWSEFSGAPRLLQWLVQPVAGGGRTPVTYMESAEEMEPGSLLRMMGGQNTMGIRWNWDQTIRRKAEQAENNWNSLPGEAMQARLWDLFNTWLNEVLNNLLWGNSWPAFAQDVDPQTSWGPSIPELPCDPLLG